MKKALPEKMFAEPDQSRLTALRTWVLDQGVTEIEMNERQFWNFAGLQPLAEKPWVTFMGRQVRVPNIEAARRDLGWRPTTDMDTAVRRTIEFYVKQEGFGTRAAAMAGI